MSENATCVIMLARGCQVSAIECQRLEIIKEQRYLTMKFQVSTVRIKTMVISNLRSDFCGEKAEDPSGMIICVSECHQAGTLRHAGTLCHAVLGVNCPQSSEETLLRIFH